MKSSIISMVTLAAAAFAAPVTVESANVARDVTDIPTGDVSGAVSDLNNILTQELGLGQLVEGATGNQQNKRDDGASKITSSGEIITILEAAIKSVQGQTGAINSTMTQVTNGEQSKDDATNDVVQQLANMHYSLTDVVTQLLDGAGLNVASGDVDRVLNLVVTLLSEVLFTVKSVVTILGLRPQLVSLLHSVFSIVASVLTLLVGLLGGLLPGLVAGLSPILAGLGNGLLAPILTPVVALVAGLSSPGDLTSGLGGLGSLLQGSN